MGSRHRKHVVATTYEEPDNYRGVSTYEAPPDSPRREVAVNPQFRRPRRETSFKTGICKTCGRMMPDIYCQRTDCAQGE